MLTLLLTSLSLKSLTFFEGSNTKETHILAISKVRFCPLSNPFYRARPSDVFLIYFLFWTCLNMSHVVLVVPLQDNKDKLTKLTKQGMHVPRLVLRPIYSPSPSKNRPHGIGPYVWFHMIWSLGSWLFSCILIPNVTFHIELGIYVQHCCLLSICVLSQNALTFVSTLFLPIACIRFITCLLQQPFSSSYYWFIFIDYLFLCDNLLLHLMLDLPAMSSI